MRKLPTVLLCAMVAACGSSVPSLSTTPLPTAPSAAPSAIPASVPSRSPDLEIAFSCSAYRQSGYMPTLYCPEEEAAVQAKAIDYGGPIARIKIITTGLPCGVPWPLGSPVCYLDPVQVAYVTFFRTDEVAALRLTQLRSGAIAAKVIEFEVPPPGWSIDTAR
jgi:hypothetical protein